MRTELNAAVTRITELLGIPHALEFSDDEVFVVRLHLGKWRGTAWRAKTQPELLALVEQWLDGWRECEMAKEAE